MPDFDPNPLSGAEGEPPRQEEGLSTADLAGRTPEPADAAEPRSFMSDGTPTQQGLDGQDGHPTPLFDPNEVDGLRSHWTDIQAGFVDEPRKAVEDADQLVARTMKRLAEVFADEREGLESQWARGDQVSTEDLRVALRRYRSFFDRLLAV